MKIIITGTHHVLDTGEPQPSHTKPREASRTTFQIQFCVATVVWQLGASSALFLNSQAQAGQRAFLQLTTPASSDLVEGSASRQARQTEETQQTLVLNSRGRSVAPETPRARLRVRLPRKSEAQDGSEVGRFSQFPAVAPLESMKAPAERDPLTPLTR